MSACGLFDQMPVVETISDALARLHDRLYFLETLDPVLFRDRELAEERRKTILVLKLRIRMLSHAPLGKVIDYDE